MNDIFKKNSSGTPDIPSGDGTIDEVLARLQGWPVDFDFETDAVCQTVFKPYIDQYLIDLKNYDNTRQHLSKYKFHIHARDAAEDVRNTCLSLGLGKKVANNMYYATLLHDLGKTQLPAKIWDIEGAPTPDEKLMKRSHVDLGCQKFEQDFASISHPFKDLVLDIMRHHHESVNGMGHFGLTGEALSTPAKLAAIVEHYDGLRHPRPHQIERGDKFDPLSIFEKIEHKYSGHFDAVLYEAYKNVKLQEVGIRPALDIKEHPEP